jgi:copper chaperone CopZ
VSRVRSFAPATAAAAALGSRKVAPALRRLPTTALRGAAVCCTATAEADIMELQLKVSSKHGLVRLRLHGRERCTSPPASALCVGLPDDFCAPLTARFPRGAASQVEGMVCDGCSGRVIEALQALPGVKSVAVDLETKLATVQVAAVSQIDAFNALPKMIETVTELGFEAAPHFD